MTETPEFSVVLPTRGDSPHLRRAIRSVLDTGERVELFVVHDRRTAEPALPSDVFSHPSIRRLESKGPGPSASRNTGIAAARAPYLAFLDDDDAWLPEHLVRARSALADHPGALLVAGDAYLLADPSPDGSRAIPPDPTGLPRFHRRTAIGPLTLRDLLLANLILTPTVVLLRAGLEQGDCFQDDLGVMEDYDLWLRLARRHRLLFDPRPTVVVRKRPGSASRDPRAMAQCSLQVLERQFALGLPAGALSSRETRVRRGRLWHDLAYACLKEGDLRGARAAVRRSIAFLPFDTKTCMYFVLSLLPARLRDAAFSAGRRRRAAGHPEFGVRGAE